MRHQRGPLAVQMQQQAAADLLARQAQRQRGAIQPQRQAHREIQCLARLRAQQPMPAIAIAQRADRALQAGAAGQCQGAGDLRRLALRAGMLAQQLQRALHACAHAVPGLDARTARGQQTTARQPVGDALGHSRPALRQRLLQHLRRQALATVDCGGQRLDIRSGILRLG